MTDTELKYLFSVELSQRELGLIGLVVAHWGAMEYEIFHQTLARFDEDGTPELPKAMNNMQFSQVLELWEANVVETSEDERRDILRKQIAEIKRLSDYRNALVHGMLQWSTGDLNRITAVRVRKDQVLSVHFTADDLLDFQTQLASINFRIRYPLGIADRAAEMEKVGSYISRAAAAMFSNHPVADELMPSGKDLDK
ncbi:hypothetical protein SAMN03159423_4515 [Bradyrhizobium sp. NFR13]|uniref:hypothetical protein n=1 Tax=Bradyrhizobium sp. NFR13 TaxID=1566285 RepID=UPI0008F16992|nr:hypothetical protein [Bradyrhizobium sp. NFR13]SFL93676.1 hypothetical protein SAMN03159423_4515 [Bradyrhizobium sp. NFR13]